MILAIDTATQYAGLALTDHNGIFIEEYWFSGRNHTVELMPRIVRALKTAGLEVSQLVAVAVPLGPGSFTGLRIGLAVAKGLALPYNLPLVGVPTLEISTRPFNRSRYPVWAVAQAGRGRIYAACYAKVDDDWRLVVEPHLTDFADLEQKITDLAFVTGEVDAAAKELIERSGKAQVVSMALRPRRAAYLAEIAAERLATGQHNDPDSLVPVYLSHP